jgi:hypothetical protein
MISNNFYCQLLERNDVFCICICARLHQFQVVIHFDVSLGFVLATAPFRQITLWLISTRQAHITTSLNLPLRCRGFVQGLTSDLGADHVTSLAIAATMCLRQSIDSTSTILVVHTPGVQRTPGSL